MTDDPIEHQARLAETFRHAARWRSEMSRPKKWSASSRRWNRRAAAALYGIAEFIEASDPNDADISQCLRRSKRRKGRYVLCLDAAVLLSRFGLRLRVQDQTEAQVRRLLRHVEHIEARERREAKGRAEAGYGDE